MRGGKVGLKHERNQGIRKDSGGKMHVMSNGARIFLLYWGVKLGGNKSLVNEKRAFPKGKRGRTCRYPGLRARTEWRQRSTGGKTKTEIKKKLGNNTRTSMNGTEQR